MRGCDDPTAARARHLLALFTSPTRATTPPPLLPPASAAAGVTQQPKGRTRGRVSSTRRALHPRRAALAVAADRVAHTRRCRRRRRRRRRRAADQGVAVATRLITPPKGAGHHAMGMGEDKRGTYDGQP